MKQSISERINARLAEAPGEIFKRGKWRFWFALVFGLSLGSAILTAMIFEWSAGSLAIGMGVLVLWTLVGTLHYSDSEDPRLARGVSLLDSIALIFVVAHFCFAMWAYGHLITIRKAEADYKAQAEKYNHDARAVQSDNVKIAEASVKAERLRNDTAYQQRKAAEAGARIRQAKSGVSLSTAPIELEKPKAPEETSAGFLAQWDRWIRLANFGELILAAITLIYIRNRSARYNAPYLSGNGPRINFQASSLAPQPVAALRQAPQFTESVATEGRTSDLARLRAELKKIAFYHPGRWFKVDPLEAGDGMWVRFCERRKGREATIAKVKWNNRVFADMNRSDFQERLTERLIDAGFPIGKGER